MGKKKHLLLKSTSFLVAISLYGYHLYQNRRDNFTHQEDYCIFNDVFVTHQEKMVARELKKEQFYVYQVPFTMIDVDDVEKIEEFSYRSKVVNTAYEIDSKVTTREGNIMLKPTDRLLYYSTYEVDIELISKEILDYPCLGEYIPQVSDKIILVKDDNQELKWVSITEAYQSEEAMKKIVGLRDIATVNNDVNLFHRVYINDEINPLLISFEEESIKVKKKK